MICFPALCWAAGADDTAGGLPRRQGGRNGGEATERVVGRLADSGPRPTEHGRGRPGKSQSPELQSLRSSQNDHCLLLLTYSMATIAGVGTVK